MRHARRERNRMSITRSHAATQSLTSPVALGGLWLLQDTPVAQQGPAEPTKEKPATGPNRLRTSIHQEIESQSYAAACLRRASRREAVRRLYRVAGRNRPKAGRSIQNLRRTDRRPECRTHSRPAHRAGLAPCVVGFGPLLGCPLRTQASAAQPPCLSSTTPASLKALTIIWHSDGIHDTGSRSRNTWDKCANGTTCPIRPQSRR